MSSIKLRVFFYDGEDESAGAYYSAERALAEGFIEIVDNEIRPTDECSIIELSTGKHDVNGDEIYQGDIIEHISGYCTPTPVEWWEVTWSYNIDKPHHQRIVGDIHTADGFSWRLNDA